MGCIYRRGRIYWIKYYRNGKPYAESSHSDKQEVAKRLLKIREGEISRGKLPGGSVLVVSALTTSWKTT